MTPPENAKPLWTESQVESVLDDFFQKEMPPALREDPPSLPSGVPKNRFAARTPETSVPPIPATPDRANSWTGGAVVILSSVLMLLVALILWDNPPANPGPNRKTVQPETNADSDNAGRRQPGQPGPDPLDALRHNGQGPVESRPRLPHVGTGDPNKPDFPELDIEVFPPDGNSGSGDDLPEKRRLPESAQPSEGHPPMPEENRSLPENGSSGAKDVDEEDTEPLLPELRSRPQEPLGTDSSSRIDDQ